MDESSTESGIVSNTKTISKLQAETFDLWLHISKYIEDTYDKFLYSFPQPTNFESIILTLADSSKTMRTGLEAFQNQQDGQELIKGIEKLDIIDKVIKQSSDVDKFSGYMFKFYTYKINGDIAQASEMILLLETLLCKCNYGRPTEILIENLFTDKCLIVKELESKFCNHIKFTSVLKNGIAKFEFNIKAKDPHFQVVLNALYKLSASEIDHFTYFVWKCLQAIIKESAEVLQKNEEFIITLPKGTSIDNITSVDSSIKIIQRLLKFIQYLSDSIVYALDNELSLYAYIWKRLPGDIIELIKCCFKDLPKNEGEDNATIEEMGTLATLTQTKLIHYNIIDKSFTGLVDFVTVNDNKIMQNECKNISKYVINILKKPILNKEMVGSTQEDQVKTFPLCAVSKSAIEFVESIQNILKKAIDAESPTVACHYVATARSLINMYPVCIEEHHLANVIPENLAVFYNNCHYIAYNLNKPEWRDELKQLPEDLREHELTGLITCDLYAIAKQKIQNYINDKVENITNKINQVPFEANLKASEVVTECLEEIELLGSAWRNNLSEINYNKYLSILYDGLCSVIIQNILQIKKSSPNLSEYLIIIINIALKGASHLFTGLKDISKFSKYWGKLGEIKFLLDTNLELIDQRWANGKGPLATHFSRNELTSLINAICLHCDKNADVLLRIH